MGSAARKSKVPAVEVGRLVFVWLCWVLKTELHYPLQYLHYWRCAFGLLHVISQEKSLGTARTHREIGCHKAMHQKAVVLDLGDQNADEAHV